MTLGIGLFAPCMILVALLGMNPATAFPIMMGSCAFLMPFGSLRFLRHGRYNLRAAVGLTLGGLPAVLVAAFIVKTLPLGLGRNGWSSASSYTLRSPCCAPQPRGPTR